MLPVDLGLCHGKLKRLITCVKFPAPGLCDALGAFLLLCKEKIKCQVASGLVASCDACLVAPLILTEMVQSWKI
jgi:hypothetical protein